MNSHHKNIKLTVESNPTRFLDTAFNVNLDGSMTSNVFQKFGKCPAFWNSQIPKWYKRNDINADLYRTFKIVSDFDAKVSFITKKDVDNGYPIEFIKSVVTSKRKIKTNQL